MPEAIGTLLNARYQLEAEIGRGGMGVVYRAHDTLLARSVPSRLTSEGTIVGTAFYLALELALGQAYGGRADLYSLGVMLRACSRLMIGIEAL